jgi:hypothetical protein
MLTRKFSDAAKSALLFNCYALRWKRVRSVFGTPVAAVFAADGILQRAVNVPEQNHTSLTPEYLGGF